MQLVGALPAKAAGQHDQELFQVGVEGRVDALLNAEFDANGHGLRRHNHVHAALDLVGRDVRRGGPLRDRNARQRRLDLSKAGRVTLQEVMINGIATDQRRQDGAEQERVRARPHRKMQVGHLGGLGAARIDHDHLAGRILADLVEMVAGIGKAVGDPWIGADHEQQVAMMDVLGGVAGLAAEHVAVDPEIAGLLLRQRVENRADPERPQHGVRIGAAGVVALPAAAIERDALATVLLHDIAQAHCDLPNRGIPVDLLEAAVGAAPERRGQAVLVTRIVGNARRLVADVTLRFRVLTVAAHLRDAAVLDQHLDATIDIADIAGRFLPLRLRHRRAPDLRLRPFGGILYDYRHMNNRLSEPAMGVKHGPVIAVPQETAKGPLAVATPTNLPVAPMCRRRCGLRRRANQVHISARPASTRRGVSRSSRTWEAGCDGRI
ncbi:hypothetical protein BRAS3843_990029 [Bradyrhizobium sp. STM 3843]|nr:hypothetical protein BRAS3843_990029 [Bradyrhizobium sp. STM 3843]